MNLSQGTRERVCGHDREFEMSLSEPMTEVQRIDRRCALTSPVGGGEGPPSYTVPSLRFHFDETLW